MPPKPQVTKPKSIKTKPKPEVPLGFEWGPLNWAVLGAGVIVLVLGYLTLAKGSITLAPILLVTGYCVFLPGSLLVGGLARRATQADATPAATPEASSPDMPAPPPAMGS